MTSHFQSSEPSPDGPFYSFRRQAKNSSRKGLCRICGDQARIINYGILSCQSCKTFVRRKASRTQVRLHDWSILYSFDVCLACSSVFIRSTMRSESTDAALLYGLSFFGMFVDGNEPRSHSETRDPTEPTQIINFEIRSEEVCRGDLN